MPAPPSWPPHPHPSTSSGLRGHFPTYRWARSTETAKESHRSRDTPVCHLSLRSVGQAQSWWFKFAEVECKTGTRVTTQEVESESANQTQSKFTEWLADYLQQLHDTNVQLKGDNTQEASCTCPVLTQGLNKSYLTSLFCHPCCRRSSIRGSCLCSVGGWRTWRAPSSSSWRSWDLWYRGNMSPHPRQTSDNATFNMHFEYASIFLLLKKPILDTSSVFIIMEALFIILSAFPCVLLFFLNIIIT